MRASQPEAAADRADCGASARAGWRSRRQFGQAHGLDHADAEAFLEGARCSGGSGAEAERQKRKSGKRRGGAPAASTSREAIRAAATTRIAVMTLYGELSRKMSRPTAAWSRCTGSLMMPSSCARRPSPRTGSGPTSATSCARR